MNEMRERMRPPPRPRYSHLVLKTHGGSHHVGSPAADLEGKVVEGARLAEAALGSLDFWGGNRSDWVGGGGGRAGGEGPRRLRDKLGGL